MGTWTISATPPEQENSGWTVSSAPPQQSQTGLMDQYQELEKQHPTGPLSIQARSGNPISNWFEDVGNDVRHGTDLTLPGKALKFLGAEGTEKGEGGGPGGVGEMVGGELIGPAQVGHAVASSFTPHNEKRGEQIASEALEGAFKTPGPFGALIPGAAPGIAESGVIGAGANKLVSTLGGDEDTSRLAGDVAAVGTPLAHGAIEKVGNLIDTHAPSIGKGIGYGTAAYKTLKTGNPLDIMYASPAATKVASVATRLLGKGISGAAQLPHPLVDTGEFTPGPVEQPVVEPKLLGRGPLIQGPGEVEQPSQTPRVQVERGKGGRMTRVYPAATVEPGTGTIMNPGRIWTPPEMPPQAPPRVINGKLVDTGESAQEQFKPLTNDSENPIINNEESNPLVNPDMSRRSFLKLGGKALAATALPGEISKPLIDAMSEEPENNFGGFSSEEDRRLFGDRASPTVSSAWKVFKHIYSEEPEMFKEALEWEREIPGQENISDDEAATRAVESMISTYEDNIHDSGYDPDYIDQIRQGLKDVSPELNTLGHPYADINKFELNNSKEALGSSNSSPETHEETEPNEHRQDSETPKSTDNEDIQDDRERNAELIQGFDKDQAASDELGRKQFYKNNKGEISRKTQQKQYNPTIPGEHGEGLLLPWAQTPWGDVGIGEAEPQEGASASVNVKPKTQNFTNPFNKSKENDYDFLNDQYRNQVLEGMEKTRGELIDTRDSGNSFPPRPSGYNMNGGDYRDPVHRLIDSSADDLNMPRGDLQQNASDILNRQNQRDVNNLVNSTGTNRPMPPLTDEQLQLEQNAFEYLAKKGYSRADLVELHPQDLLDMAKMHGFKE